MLLEEEAGAARSCRIELELGRRVDVFAKPCIDAETQCGAEWQHAALETTVTVNAAAAGAGWPLLLTQQTPQKREKAARMAAEVAPQQQAVDMAAAGRGRSSRQWPWLRGWGRRAGRTVVSFDRRVASRCWQRLYEEGRERRVARWRPSGKYCEKRSVCMRMRVGWK